MPLDAPGVSAGLAGTAHARLITRFAAYGHTPSAEQWEAIRDLLGHLERAAMDDLDPALYVSAIAAGTGKTQSIAAFAEALMASPAHANVGMLITVNRITEAADMADHLRDHRDRLCIITSDAETNAKGAHVDVDCAQLCIATQASLKQTMSNLRRRGGSFDDATRFHYQGRRRAVIAWDEVLQLNRPVVLDTDAVGNAVKAMRRQYDQAANTLKQWAADTDKLTGLCAVPNFEAMGVDFDVLEDDVAENAETVVQVKALAVISGDQGYISRQGRSSGIVTHYPELPASIMPVVVTDASARINPSYAQMGLWVPVRLLKDAPKTYRNMTLRIVPLSGSRAAFRAWRKTTGRDLLDMAVRYIASVPADCDVLVIGYKGHVGIKGVRETNLKDALFAKLTAADRQRVHYLNYGHHTATNAYTHARHVLLLGLNYLPRTVGHAASGAALDLNLKDQHPTQEQMAAMQNGLLMDSTLQALLRGNARLGDNGDCGIMEAVIPQTNQVGLSEADYQRMFPGVNVIHDETLLPPVALKGRIKQLAEIVARRLQAGETTLTYHSLYGEMGMTAANFGKLLKRTKWKAYAASLGLWSQRLTGSARGLKLIRS